MPFHAPHLSSIFLVVLVPRTRSCFFLQTGHSRMIFCRFPCFFTVFSPARLPPWPIRLRLCARLPAAIDLALPLLATLTFCFVCFLHFGQYAFTSFGYFTKNTSICFFSHLRMQKPFCLLFWKHWFFALLKGAINILVNAHILIDVF